MTEDPPSHPGVAAHVGPPVGQWAPGHPTPRVPASRMWPAVAVCAIALALIATVVAVVALVMATTRSPVASPAPTATAPTYSAAEISAAHQKLCSTYKFVAHVVQIETNGKNPERANLATVNSALMLEDTVNRNPAIAPGDRAAALALAESYSNVAATSSLATGSDDPVWRLALSDANAKDVALSSVCGGG